MTGAHLATLNAARAARDDLAFCRLAALADTEVSNADAAAERTGLPAAVWLECERLLVGEEIKNLRRAGQVETPAFVALQVRRRALEMACANLEIVEPR